MPRRARLRPSGPTAPVLVAAVWAGAACAQPAPPVAMPVAPPVAVPVAVAEHPAPRVPAPMRDDAVAASLWGLVELAQRLVRTYAQLGLEARAAAAAAAVPETLRAGDRLLASLAAGAQRRVAPARVRELERHWRGLREAVATRPSPQIARLMDEVARQLGALAAEAAAGLPPAPRATRQRTLLHRMAGTYLLACWGAMPAAPEALLAMRAEFGRLLAERARAGADDLDAATLSSQWGLLADGLDGHGGPCDLATADRVASTTDRLAQLLDPLSARPVVARRP